MYTSEWNNKLGDLSKIITKHIFFNDLKITLLDAISALHPINWSVPTHQHPWFEFNYISQGTVYTTLEGKEFAVKAGEYFLIPPGRVHSHRNYKSIGDDGLCLRWKAERICLSIENEGVSGIAESLIRNLSESRPYAVKIEMHKFIQAIRNKSEIQIQLEFIKWLVYLSNLMNEGDIGKVAFDNRDTILTQQVLLYLLEYYDRELKVQEISDALNISYRHIARIFKRDTGQTIIEKLNEIRIEEAKKLILNTNMLIHTIAYQTGFKNEFYFANIFKRHTGLAPSQYRMQSQSSV